MIAHRIAGPPARPTSRPTHRNTLALAVTLAALVPTVQWMWLEHDLHAGLARVHAYLSEPPARAEADRTLAWDYLGNTPRVGRQPRRLRGRVRPRRRDHADAALALHLGEGRGPARALHRIARDPRAADGAGGYLAGAWGARASSSQQLRDTVAARMAAARALALDPNDPLARDVIHDLGNGPATPARP